MPAVLDEVSVGGDDDFCGEDVCVAGMEDDGLRMVDLWAEGECCTRKRSGQVAIYER